MEERDEAGEKQGLGEQEAPWPKELVHRLFIRGVVPIRFFQPKQ